MRLVSIGDLVIDYYYQDNRFLGVCGGNTSHNIIANLAIHKIPTKVISVCGNDIQGEIAIKSLEDLGTDIEHIIKLDNVRTRSLHVSYFMKNGKVDFESKRRCPKCNTKTWYSESLLDVDYVKENINEDDILVFDNLNSKNQSIIDSTPNKKLIDLGQYFEFEKIEEDELIDKIRDKFEIINFNERVTKYLLERFQLSSDLELYSLLRPKLMTITRGEEGATFIYDNKVYNFPLISMGKVVDPTGAGDAFFSSIIIGWIDNNFEYTPRTLKKWYKNSNNLTSVVVSKMGARGHIYPLYEVIGTDKCTCIGFNFDEKVFTKKQDKN